MKLNLSTIGLTMTALLALGPGLLPLASAQEDPNGHAPNTPCPHPSGFGGSGWHYVGLVNGLHTYSCSINSDVWLNCQWVDENTDNCWLGGWFVPYNEYSPVRISYPVSLNEVLGEPIERPVCPTYWLWVGNVWTCEAWIPNYVWTE